MKSYFNCFVIAVVLCTLCSATHLRPLAVAPVVVDCGTDLSYSFATPTISETIKRGKKAELSTGPVNGTDSFKDGTLVINALLNGASVLSKNTTLCGNSDPSLIVVTMHIEGATCPVEGEMNQLNMSLTMPIIAPPGSYEFTFKGYSGEQKYLFCLKGTFKL